MATVKAASPGLPPARRSSQGGSVEEPDLGAKAKQTDALPSLPAVIAALEEPSPDLETIVRELKKLQDEKDAGRRPGGDPGLQPASAAPPGYLPGKVRGHRYYPVVAEDLQEGKEL